MSSVVSLDGSRPVEAHAAAAWPIVVVTTFFPSSIDPQRTVFVRNLVQAMRRQREVTVISPTARRPWPGRRPLPARQEQVDGVAVSRPRFLTFPGLGWLSGLSYFAAIIGPLYRLRRERGPFVLHAHCAYPDGVGVTLAARWLGLPSVVTAHGSDINVYAARPLLRVQMAWALRRVSAVVAVSRALSGKVAGLVGRAPTETACIPCAGFDPGVFAPADRAAARAQRGTAADARVVVFVGQLVAVKQVDRLVAAWGELQSRGRLQPQDRLVLVGAGPKRAELERQAQALGVEGAVQFAGAVPQGEVSAWLAAADLLCLPSRSEGMPNVVVEALASGVPVVASAVGGIPEIVRDGGNGLLVPPGDAAALAEALRRALEQSWDRDAIRGSVAHLTWSTIAQRNLDLIDRVTAKAAHAAVA